MMEFSAVNTIWVLLGAALVFFMQAGFAMVGNRLYKSEERRQHYHEEPDGFCHWYPFVLAYRLRHHVRAASPFFGGFDFFADGVVGEATTGRP